MRSGSSPASPIRSTPPPATASGSAATAARPGKTGAGASRRSSTSGRSRSAPTSRATSSPARPPRSADAPKAVPRDGLGYGLYESKDSGETWARVLRSFPENPHFDAIADIRFDPAEPTHAAVAFESGEMWISLNGGDYWQPFARDIRSARVLCGVG